ncbi:MAG: gas vesicle protein GvpJ [Opitutaceae bacterium]|nr:gas vesicle protein GvpJ [Opitutaceae bacterium]
MTDLSGNLTQGVSLCDALDRVLSTGVVALGELKISVAEVDLLYIGLQLVVCSVESGRDLGPMIADSAPPDFPRQRHPLARPLSLAETGVVNPTGRSAAALVSPSSSHAWPAETTRLSDGHQESATAKSAGQCSDKNGLGKLVLTLVKLLHKLLKLQALRRMEAGSLNDAEIESLGMTLMRQAQEIERMAKEFGLQPEDLNLDLGPLGKLM